MIGENWIKVGNFLTPGLEIKAFEEDEKDDAIDWFKRRINSELNN